MVAASGFPAGKQTGTFGCVKCINKDTFGAPPRVKGAQRILIDRGDLAPLGPTLVLRQCTPGLSVEQDLPGVWGTQTQDDRARGRFPGTGFPNNAEHLACFEFKTHVVDCGMVAAIRCPVALCQTLGADVGPRRCGLWMMRCNDWLVWSVFGSVTGLTREVCHTRTSRSYGAEQFLGIWVLWGTEDLVGVPGLDDLATFHDEDFGREP